MKDNPLKPGKTQVECICEILREQIRAGALSHDGKLPAMRKLSERLGYPLNSIWRAMTILKDERYLSTTATGRYLVHPRFSLRSRGDKTLRIGFMGHGELAISNRFIQRVYSAIDQNQDGFNISLTLLLGTDEKMYEHPDLARFDGVILGAGWSHSFYDKLRKSNRLVTALTPPFHLHLPGGVRIDNFRGGELAGKAFCERGVQRMVLLGESQSYPTGWHAPFELRAIGFLRSWLQHGNLSRNVIQQPLPEDLLPRMREIESIVSTQNEFTGYFALSDVTALMLLSALRDRGIRVPEDAIVLGFDDHPEAATADPPLATLCPNPKTIAEKLILQLRTMEVEPEYSEMIYVKPRLIERESMGAAT